MHTEARAFVASLTGLLSNNSIRTVIEFGSRNVNGTIKDLFLPLCSDYYGIDVAAWPGVDIVANAAYWEPLFSNIDVVVCCEMLEHCIDAPRVCLNAYKILAPGGWFIATMANEKRQAHSTTAGPLPKDEYYCPVTKESLSWWMRPFSKFFIEERHDDLYVVGMKTDRV